MDGLSSGIFYVEIKVRSQRTFHWNRHSSLSVSTQWTIGYLLSYFAKSRWLCRQLSRILWLRFCSQLSLGNWKKGGKSGRRQREGKKEGERLRGGTEGRGRKAEKKGGRGKEMKESGGGGTFVPCFYLNVLIYHKVCPMDSFPLFSGWALQRNSCVGGISTCDSCFMWEMNLPVMWETVGKEKLYCAVISPWSQAG